MSKSRSYLFAAGAASLLPLLISLSARADTLTLGAAQDNSIFQNYVNNSDGAGPAIFSGASGGTTPSPRRGLIEFTIAGNVPAGATITAVQLQLTVGLLGGGSTAGRTISLYSLTDGWGEGTAGASSTIGGTGQGAAAGNGDATWNANHFGISTWTTAGGDFNAASSATESLSSVAVNSVFTWNSAGMVSDVQGWLNNPSSNDGWELINAAETTSQSLLAFYSREGMQVSGVTAGQLPQLSITYTVPEPADLAWVAAGTGVLILGARWRRRCA